MMGISHILMCMFSYVVVTIVTAKATNKQIEESCYLTITYSRTSFLSGAIVMFNVVERPQNKLFFPLEVK